jgi:hypothetical protein
MRSLTCNCNSKGKNICGMRYWQTMNLLGSITYSSCLQQGGKFTVASSRCEALGDEKFKVQLRPHHRLHV